MPAATETAPPPVVAAKEAPPAVVPPVAKVEVPAVVVPPVEAAKAPEAPRSLLADPLKADATPAKPGDPTAPAKTGEQPPTEWKLEIPKDSGLTADHLKQVETFAREHQMTADQAQKLVERDATARAANATEGKAAIAKTTETWNAEAAQKFGTKLPEVVQNAKRALTQWDKTGAFRKLLNDTPYGSNALLLEFLNEAGSTLREDVPPVGAAAPAKPTDPVKAFYGDDHTKPSTR